MALRVVEIRGDGDDSAVDHVVEIFLCPGFEFAKNVGRNFRRRKKLVAEANANHVAARFVDSKREARELVLNVRDATTHQALYGIDRAVGLREETLPGRLADENFSFVRNANDRRA